MLVPGIDGHQGASRFTGQLRCENADNGFFQLFPAFSRGTGETDSGSFPPVRMDSQVALVQDQQTGRVAVFSQKGGGAGEGGVRHFQNQVCRFKRPVGAQDAGLFDEVGRFPDSCRVNQAQGQTGDLDGFFHGVPRSSGNIADDGALVSQQGIEQAGFADVGRSRDGRPDAFPQQTARGSRAQQAGKLFLRVGEP